MTLYERGLFVTVLYYWGVDNQIRMVLEEMAELQLAICKRMRDKPNDNVEEEIADLSIMLDQLKIMCDSDLIDRFRHDKIKRLDERVRAWCKEHPNAPHHPTKFLPSKKTL